MSLPELIDADGQLVRLGGEIARGGEGAVFHVQSHGGHVAKLYFSDTSKTEFAPPSKQHQAKLKAAIQAATVELCSVAAWPAKTVHSKRSGEVYGFLMPNLGGFDKIHLLYRPKDRKRLFPHLSWDSLILVAASLADAVATIHRHEHVVGDINESNLLVSKTGDVKLIDCDSFQVFLQCQVYPCNVGVDLYQPPELQEMSLNARSRSKEHDSFGLAVMVFMLLYMGRHPFSGKWLDKSDVTVIRAIKEHRFAFSSTANRRNASPPPFALSLDHVSSELAWMFELAFAPPVNGRYDRPSASDWSTALRQFRNQLRDCPNSKLHKIPHHLPSCPWCDFVARGGPDFFPNGPKSSASASYRSAVATRPIQQAVGGLPTQAIPQPPIASSLSTLGQKRLLIGGTAVAAFVLFVAFITSRDDNGRGTPPMTPRVISPAVPIPAIILKPVNLPPVVAITGISPASPQSGDTVVIRFEIRDPEGDGIALREYKTNRDQKWRTVLGKEIVLVDQSEGLLQVSVRVRDTVGNLSEVKTVSVQVLPKPNLPPVVTIASILPQSPESGDTIVIRFEARDPEGDRIVLREYKTNRDQNWRTVLGNEIVLVDQDEGSLQVFIRVADSAGKLSEMKIATKQIDPPRWSSAIAEAPIKAHRLGVSAISFDADGQRFATAGDDSVVKLWSPDNALVWEIKTRAMCLAFDPEGSHIATGGKDKKLHLWRLSDGKPVAEMEGPKDTIRTLAFSPLDNSVAVGSDDGQVYIWELAAQRRLQTPNLKFKSIYSVAFDPHGQVLAAAGSAGSGSGLLVATRYKPGIGATEEGQKRDTESDLISSVAFSADGKWIATCAWNGFVRIRHLKDMSVKQSLGPVGHVNSIQFSPNGQLLAAGVANESNGAIRIWNTKTWREVKAQTTAPASVMSIAFDKVGNRLIAGCSDGVVRIWRKRN